MKDRVRIGVMRFQSIGSYHSRHLNANTIQGADLTPVWDASPQMHELAKANMNPGVTTFAGAGALLAFQRGLHVVVEKPAGVSARQVRQMNGVAKKSRRIFGIMFNK